MNLSEVQLQKCTLIKLDERSFSKTAKKEMKRFYCTGFDYIIVTIRKPELGRRILSHCDIRICCLSSETPNKTFSSSPVGSRTDAPCYAIVNSERTWTMRPTPSHLCAATTWATLRVLKLLCISETKFRRIQFYECIIYIHIY